MAEQGMVWKESGAGNHRLWPKPRIGACLWPGKGSGEKGQNSQTLWHFQGHQGLTGPLGSISVFLAYSGMSMKLKDL